MNFGPLGGYVIAAATAIVPSGGLGSGPLGGLTLSMSNAETPLGGLLVFIVSTEDLEVALHAKLVGSTAIEALVDDRVFYANLPQRIDLGRDGPALTYVIAERTPGHDLVGSDGTQIAIARITAYGYRIAEADQVTEAVRGVLFDGLPWGNGSIEILSVVHEDEGDEFGNPRAGSDQWTYQIASDYSIKHRVTIPTLS